MKNPVVKAAVRNLFSSVLITVLAHSALGGQRVLVVLKDQNTFRAVHTAYRSHGMMALKSLGLKSTMAQVDGKIESSLEHLKTLVVDAKDDLAVYKLKQDPSVAYVEKEIFHAAPRPVAGWVAHSIKTFDSGAAVPGHRTPWGIMAVKAPQAWAISSQGQGARVLVLDTGIDENHPSLKANIEKGRDFTEEGEGNSVEDSIGHGTHVAGTIAGIMGSEGFTGVAPKAKLLIGRVCSGRGCSNVAVAEGINWGISENVDVISMSLGGAMSTPAEQDAVAKADKAGITVIAASGNDGSNKVSYPAALPTVIAVGAVDEKAQRAPFSQFGPELAIMAPGVNVVSSVPLGTGREASVTILNSGAETRVASATFQGAREVLDGETNVLVDVGFGRPEEFNSAKAKGKFALVSRGEIPFGEKVKNAMAAGASGVVVYNNAPGLVQGALTADGSTLPIAVFMIEKEVGQKIVQEMKKGNLVQANLRTLAVDFASFQGTSMATPHVAGVAALVKATNKRLTGAQVKEILMATAKALGPNNNNEYGAGMIDAEAAVRAAYEFQ